MVENVVYIASRVVSCPPCTFCALVNPATGLSASFPWDHSPPVVSMNCLN